MTIVRCTSCQRKNRLKEPPEGQLPVCGNCGATLPWLINSSDTSFDADLKAAVPVLVDFWAPWCGPCKMIAPVLEELSREKAGKLKIIKLNVDENPQISARFNARSIPTLKLFKAGKELETIVGALPKGALLQKLKPYL